MPVSCSLQKVVCCLSWLAVLLCEVLAQFKKKKHVKKGLDRTKALWEEGYAGSRAVGPSLMAITSLVPFVTVSSLVPFVTVSVVTVVVVSVLMLIFL